MLLNGIAGGIVFILAGAYVVLVGITAKVLIAEEPPPTMRGEIKSQGHSGRSALVRSRGARCNYLRPYPSFAFDLTPRG
jgi:hypothetical protein